MTNINNPIWFDVEEEKQALYIKLNEVEQQVSIYDSFLAELQNDNTSCVMTKIIFDLRYLQSQMSNFNLQDLIESILKYSNSETKLFTIIDNSTFNSGVDLAYELKHNHGSLLIGEPTGGRLNHTSSVKSFLLPNYQHSIFYPTSLIQNSAVDADYLEPDIQISLNSEEYFNLIDPLVEFILAQ